MFCQHHGTTCRKPEEVIGCEVRIADLPKKGHHIDGQKLVIDQKSGQEIFPKIHLNQTIALYSLGVQHDKLQSKINKKDWELSGKHTDSITKLNNSSNVQKLYAINSSI